MYIKRDAAPHGKKYFCINMKNLSVCCIIVFGVMLQTTMVS